MSAGELDKLDELFFNFNVQGHLTASTRKQIIEESDLLDQYFELIEG